MSSKARAELESFPKYKQIYILTFEKMIKERLRLGKTTEWKTGQEVLDWWLPLKNKTWDKRKHTASKVDVH